MGKDRGWEYLNSSGDEFDYDKDNDGSWGYEDPDGSGSFFGKDGSWGYKNSDGSASYFGADGSWGYKNSDGSSSYFGKDGSWGYRNTDGSGSFFGRDNDSEYYDAVSDDDTEDEESNESPGYLLGQFIGLMGMEIAKAVSESQANQSNEQFEKEVNHPVGNSRKAIRNYKKQQKRYAKQRRWYLFKQKVKRFFTTVFVIVALCGAALLGYKIWVYKSGIEVGFSSSSLINKNYEEVSEMFEESGFTNVYCKPIYDLKYQDISDEYTVAAVVIQGKSAFSSTDKFPYGTRVEIQYHVLANVYTPVSAKDSKNMNYLELVSLLENAGFVNITLVEDPDLVTGWITKEGSVEEVKINGNTKFFEKESYRPDVEVIIVYHTF